MATNCSRRRSRCWISPYRRQLSMAIAARPHRSSTTMALAWSCGPFDSSTATASTPSVVPRASSGHARPRMAPAMPGISSTTCVPRERTARPMPPPSRRVRPTGGHEDDGDVLEPRTLADERSRLEAVHVGHVDVEQDDREFTLEELAERVLAG